MKTEIRSLHLELTAALRQHVARRLSFALDRFRAQVDSVRARLADLNGPHGGEDKLCVVTVEARGLRPVRAQAVDSDLYAAVDLAAETVRRRLTRALERRRDQRVDGARRAKRRQR